jgi:demethylmenaquinone methyltransferase/2-methoxy-6-polyprenyl-1,4-benzoquinol methylase
MFDQVARRYDLVNTLASLGQDHLWRRAVIAAIEPRPGERVLDLAAGTGASSVPLIARGAEVVATDLSVGMVTEGARRHPEISFVVGDAVRLPFADSAFDIATISFGLRNVVDPLACLVELRRVVRPGGTLVICEFSTPTWAPFRRLYHGWLSVVLPAVARIASSNDPAYGYLAESILAWPVQEQLAATLAQAGWNEIEWRDLTGGIVALHRAQRP